MSFIAGHGIERGGEKAREAVENTQEDAREGGRW
jgi:hypothetical protein